MHRYHPDPNRADDTGRILYDDCDRCAEHANAPFTSMDDGQLVRLLDLHRRWDADEAGRLTHAERRAVRIVDGVVRAQRRIDQLAASPLAHDAAREIIAERVPHETSE